MSITKDVAVRLSLTGADQVKAQLTGVTQQADKLGTKTATIKIDANDDNWEVDAKEVLAQAAEMGANKVQIQVTASDDQAKIALDEIQKQADELGLKKVTIKVAVDDSGAMAKLGAVDAASGGSGAAGDAGGLLGGTAGGMGPGILGLSPLASTITGLAAAAVAVLPALTAVAGGLAVVGGGFAALMLTDKQFATQVESTFKGLESVVKEAVAPMAGPMLDAVKQLASWAKSLGPELKGIFTEAIPLIKPLMSGLEGLVSNMLPGFSAMIKAALPAMEAFSALLKNLGGSLGSMFKDFAAAMKPSSIVLEGLGKVINALLPFIGQLAEILSNAIAPAFLQFGNALAKILPALTPVIKLVGDFAGAVLGDLMSVLSSVGTLLENMAPAFNVLSKALSGVFNTLENSGAFAEFGDMLEEIAKPLGQLISLLITQMAPVIPIIVKALDLLIGVLTGLGGHVLALVITGFAAIFKILPPLAPALLTLAVAWKAVTIAQAAFNIVADMNPWILIIGGVLLVIGVIVELVKHWNDVTAVLREGMSFIVGIMKAGWSDVRGAMDDAISFMESIFKDFVSHVESYGNDVVSFMRRIPGEIVSAFSDLGGMMMSIGRNIIDGLISGVEGAVGGLLSTVSRIAGDVSGAFKSVLGIFSPSKVFASHGADIVRGLALGITSNSHLATEAVSGLAARVSMSGAMHAGTLAGAASSSQQLQVQFVGGADSEFMTALKKMIRIRGGNPSVVGR